MKKVKVIDDPWPTKRQQAQGEERSGRLDIPDNLTVTRRLKDIFEEIENNGKLFCPHCGEEQDEIYLDGALDDLASGVEHKGEMTCGSCEEDFFWSREVMITFTTSIGEDE